MQTNEISPTEKSDLPMDGVLRQVETGYSEALLASPCIQNHAAFLARGSYSGSNQSAESQQLSCLWFGGSLEGSSDISIYRSSLHSGVWQPASQLTDDPSRSDQNPLQFQPSANRTLLLHTAQPGGAQEACAVRMREPGTHDEPVDLPLPSGTFIRAPIQVRADGAWLLPLFRCVPRSGQRWTGSHDVAAVAISNDEGLSWREIGVPDSMGCVHMTMVPFGNDRFAAFFRRRQADYVYRTESLDAGESWQAPVATDIPNNNSSISVVRLHDDRIAMACNPVNATMHSDRRESLYDDLEDDTRPNATGGCQPIWGVPRAPMAICFSNDNGVSFSHKVIVEQGPGTCLSNNSKDGSNLELSYPSLLEQQDGSLDLAYTWHRRAIKHVQLSKEWIADNLRSCRG